MFAFGERIKLAPEGWEPLSYDDIQGLSKGTMVKSSGAVKERFKRPPGNVSNPTKKPPKKKQQGKFGPYFRKGGRLSRKPIRG